MSWSSLSPAAGPLRLRLAGLGASSPACAGIGCSKQRSSPLLFFLHSRAHVPRPRTPHHTPPTPTPSPTPNPPHPQRPTLLLLAEMQKKLRFNPEELFVSLVVEPAPGMQQEAGSSRAGSGGAGSRGAGQPGVVGVVEVSYITTRETLARLEPGTEGFCYVASMVVAPAWRRRGAAQALLAAAELAAGAWEERQTLLYVYQDNEPAIGLYRAAGYEVLHSEKRRFGGLGARPRHLMRKRW